MQTNFINQIIDDNAELNYQLQLQKMNRTNLA